MQIYNFKSKISEKTAKSGLAKNLNLKTAKKHLKKNWMFYLTWGVRLAAAGTIFLALMFFYYSFKLPNPNRLLQRDVTESTKIFDRNGGLIYEIHGEVKRTQITLDQVTDDLKNATIAIEDKDFYKHNGFSVTGLARSVLVDIFTVSKSQGGSTITQQFVKNAVLSRDKSFIRKFKEIILSIEMEARFSKADILKFYLNEIPYGRNAYGIEAASQSYFGKSAKDLSLAESAYLAALPQAPTYYNPNGPHFDALEARKNTVLRLMKEQGYINEDDYNKAKDEKVTFKEAANSIVAPHFSLYVQDYLASKYGEKSLEEGGLKVYTTLDPDLQKAAEEAITKNLEAYGKQRNVHNASLVALDPKTGQILAMVGSKDYFAKEEPENCTPKDCLFSPNVNVALTNQQPGSSFKPLAYVTAFGKDFRYSPASMLMDVVTNFGDYTPRNFNLSENGPVSIRKALAGSLNIPAVKILALVGVENVVQTARDLGITNAMQDCGLSLVLGGCDVKLIDHVSAYGVFATEGEKHDRTAILKVVDQTGETLEEYQDKSKQVLDPQAAYELISIMTDNNARLFTFGGSAQYLTLPDRPVAAKTGTTQDFRDGWTMGFTPSLVAGVWTGNNNNEPMKADAVMTAGPIWKSFMLAATKGKPVEEFPVPEGIKKITVDAVSGKLPGQFTLETKTEVFADYAVPTEYDNVHVGVKIDSLTGQPATSDTPQERIIVQPYTVLHSEKPDNFAWEGPVQEWAIKNGFNYPPTGGETVDTPPVNEPSQLQVDIVSPQSQSTISKLPFQFTANVSPQSDVARVDLSIDGQLIQSISNAPYSVTVNKKYSDGPHTLAVKATGKNGSTKDASISVNFSLNPAPALELLDPVDGDTLDFPVGFNAQSSTAFPSISYYYQIGTTTKLIGTVKAGNPVGGVYYYPFTWLSSPKAGTYKIYAKSSTGITSQQITVQIK